jgi:hypothetical protein
MRASIIIGFNGVRVHRAPVSLPSATEPRPTPGAAAWTARLGGWGMRCGRVRYRGIGLFRPRQDIAPATAVWKAEHNVLDDHCSDLRFGRAVIRPGRVLGQRYRRLRLEAGGTWLACARCDSVDILARSRQRQAGTLAVSPRQHFKVLIAVPLAPRALTAVLRNGHPGQKRPMIADGMGILDGAHASLTRQLLNRSRAKWCAGVQHSAPFAEEFYVG